MRNLAVAETTAHIIVVAPLIISLFTKTIGMYQFIKFEYRNQIQEKKYIFYYDFRRIKFLIITDKKQNNDKYNHTMDQITLQSTSFSEPTTILLRPSTSKYPAVLPNDRQATFSATSHYPPQRENKEKKTFFQSKATNNYYLTPSQSKAISHPMKINLNAIVRLELQHNGTRNQQSSISPSQKQAIKPKIQFSYNRDNSNSQKDRKKGTLSLNNKEDSEQQFALNEFDLFNRKKSKEQKRSKLSISSNILSYVYLGSNEAKKETSSQIMEKSSKADTTKCSGTSGISINSNSYLQQHQNRLVKMSSAKNTQSFLSNNRRSGFPREKKQIKSNQKENHQQQQFNHSCSSKRPSLMDKLQSSKNLKKTVFLNNYDFGGIFLQKNSKIDHNSKLPVREKAMKQSTDHKWKTIVKCLVQQQNQTDNLKQSIHCGPQIRLEKHNCALLDKLGRDVAGSFIPADD